MNFVFWLPIIIVLVLVWLCLSFAFKGVGSIWLHLWHDAKHEMMDEEDKEHTNIRKDEFNSER